MSEKKKDNITIDSNAQAEKIVINSKGKVKDGQVKCPNCGASDIEPNPKTGKLRCNYCYTEFLGDKVEGTISDLKKLEGRLVGSGTNDINKDASNVVTLKCGGCGAEVVIDTSEAPHARCHWCRSILSINNKLENGAIPDVILPFSKKKEEAQSAITAFVKKRRFFANPTFKKEFTTDNIMGVYFPYMLVDANCHAKYDGKGEHQIRRYTVGSGDNEKTRYDADLYHVKREFDITIDDLTIESNSNRLDKTSNTQTNNIINSIMPFDTQNCIQYKSNYLVGYTSERRDVNIDDLNEKVTRQLSDVSRYAANRELTFYNRGVKWETEDFKIIGTQWLAAYLPVWLYSYQEVKGKKKILHYVAVNARTGETMGSVPINTPLLLGISALIEFIVGGLGVVLFFLTMPTVDSDDDSTAGFLLLLLSGFIFYGIMYARYRNKDARHKYELETREEISNLVKEDEFIERRRGLSNPMIEGQNNNLIVGDIINGTKIKIGNINIK